MGSATPAMGQGPAGDRSQAERPVWLCSPSVAVDHRANIWVAGPMATAQGRLRVFARDNRGTHSHCNDSADAAKIGADLTLFKRPLNSLSQKRGQVQS